MNDMRFINCGINKTHGNLSELFVLIKNNPNLPIIPCVDSEIVADDGYNSWLGSWGKARIVTFLSTEKYGMVEKEYDSALFERWFDYEECGITKEMSDAEAEKIMQEKIDSLPWQTAILVSIDLPHDLPEFNYDSHGRLKQIGEQNHENV